MTQSGFPRIQTLRFQHLHAGRLLRSALESNTVRDGEAGWGRELQSSNAVSRHRMIQQGALHWDSSLAGSRLEAPAHARPWLQCTLGRSVALDVAALAVG